MTGQSETEHTPGKLQWEVGYRDPDVLTESGDLFASVYTDERCEADSARIVLTWNCHDELVAALKRIAAPTSPERLTGDHLTAEGRAQLAFAMIDNFQAIARAALAKATSPTP